MKRRVIKKWVNRYINPLIKDLPRADCSVIELVNEKDSQLVHISKADNYIFVNGVGKREGEIGARSRGLLNDIRLTSESVKNIIGTLKNPHFRTFEVNRRCGVYIRLVDFSDWPEGYFYKSIDDEKW
ncbi:hypothetical protein [Paenibacillus macerans]|uniref:hypothetical protein n=1 Tax=Paenibacillus macerans TaxID=44252 RepID=UPI00203B8E3A|nr:hypothetical protein [Paenibacillus macerans]MCM3703809.1 hypothetical protein [Paenibacillus macerans]